MQHCNRHRGLACWLVSVILFSLAPRYAAAVEPAASLGKTHIQKRFEIGREGRVIILPLRVDNQEVLSLIDTGASRSGFDLSLKPVLGASRGRQTLSTAAGDTHLETFDWPNATLAGSALRTEKPVVGLDLTEIRQATNAEIYAVIGMDVLREKRLQIDFDRGELRFLDEIPPSHDKLGVKIPIEFAPDGTAYLQGTVADDHRERFLIDTGTQGQSLTEEAFDALCAKKHIRLGGKFTSVTVGGEVRGNRGQLDLLAIGPFKHSAVRFSRINVNSLGLRYLARFRVTLDFPGRSAYLQPGDRYGQREPQATSGMALLWRDGDVVVHSVQKDGPGSDAGLKKNDVLVEIDGEPASEFDPFSLRQLLTSVGGRKVPMTIRRSGRFFAVEIVLHGE